ncbi:metal-dependent hydrolase [Natrononativus amylolyticus]|uniref:metal-dependent hydrolase n=1 Tax=Natrononativus amylolyticus TaxID=2963434 RepID=UPI0020CF9217|nr:metal-dependent hydrolase [Natrononativus amylolyticus]
MWPWEHAVVGYLAYSLFCHLYYRESPGGLEALVVVFASVLPDLIDKPLAWEFGVFESGYALGHSVFFAVPLALLVGTGARLLGRPRVGVAFGVGYLLHLPADVLPAYAEAGHLPLERVLWPVAPVQADERRVGFTDRFAAMVGEYWHELLAGDPSTYMWAQLGLLLAATLLWLYDGAPVARELVVGSTRRVRRWAGRTTD